MKQLFFFISLFFCFTSAICDDNVTSLNTSLSTLKKQLTQLDTSLQKITTTPSIKEMQNLFEQLKETITNYISSFDEVTDHLIDFDFPDLMDALETNKQEFEKKKGLFPLKIETLTKSASNFTPELIKEWIEKLRLFNVHFRALIAKLGYSSVTYQGKSKDTMAEDNLKRRYRTPDQTNQQYLDQSMDELMSYLQETQKLILDTSETLQAIETKKSI